MNSSETQRLESEIRHVKDALDAHKEMDILRHTSEEQARVLALSEIDRRLSDHNRFREENLADRAKYVTREVYDKFDEMTDSRLKILEQARSNLEGRIWAIGAVILVINLIARVFWK